MKFIRSFLKLFFTVLAMLKSCFCAYIQLKLYATDQWIHCREIIICFIIKISAVGWASELKCKSHISHHLTPLSLSSNRMSFPYHACRFFSSRCPGSPPEILSGIRSAMSSVSAQICFCEACCDRIVCAYVCERSLCSKFSIQKSVRLQLEN